MKVKVVNSAGLYWISTQLEMLTSSLVQAGVMKQLSHMGKTNWGKRVNICSSRPRITIRKTKNRMAVLKSARGLKID